MSEERVIEGVLHVLEGKTYRPLTAEELTQRLLEARRVVDERPVVSPLPIAPNIYPAYWPRQPWDPPSWITGRPYIGDVITPNPHEITSGSAHRYRVTGTERPQ